MSRTDKNRAELAKFVFDQVDSWPTELVQKTRTKKKSSSSGLRENERGESTLSSRLWSVIFLVLSTIEGTKYRMACRFKR